MRLNIGCGHDKREGFVGLDISPDVGADIVCDIEQGIPLKDNECEEVICLDVLEQMSSAKAFVFVMNELWRITKLGGSVHVRVPNAKDICAFQDPMDSRHFTEETFTYMGFKHQRYERYGKHYGFKPWVVGIVENGAQIRLILNPVK